METARPTAERQVTRVAFHQLLRGQAPTAEVLVHQTGLAMDAILTTVRDLVD